MATKKKRINVSLPRQVYVLLQKISLRDEVPQATKAAQLIEKAMEIEEDEYFSALADARAKECNQWISHEEFWSDVNSDVQD